MNMKLRIILSIITALVVMAPLIVTRPDKIAGFFIFTIVAFITIFIITSLFNIKNTKMKIAYLSVVAIGFLYKFYANYFVMQWVLPKSIITSLVFAGVFALIFRGISLLTEKKEISTTAEQDKV
ncbi:hypothetical protein [Sulfurimonas sp.]|uniref:hypothetical protein n=1 Tax=Sulfurimonas sp. TaxID=2022749 RepID=UPI002AB2BB5D|nr:hypothetical protein [Sulfurimonas sp.]